MVSRRCSNRRLDRQSHRRQKDNRHTRELIFAYFRCLLHGLHIDDVALAFYTTDTIILRELVRQPKIFSLVDDNLKGLCVKDELIVSNFKSQRSWFWVPSC